MYLRKSFKKNGKLIYILYIICSIVAYRFLGKHQDGRLALIWIIFIVLAVIHFIEELATKYFKHYNNLYVYLGITVFIVASLYFIFTIPLQLYFSVTPSMVPTIYPENVMLIKKMAYRSKKPQRNDIVLISRGPDKIPVIHRIIACPHDTVEVRHRTLTVNGQEIEFGTLNSGGPRNITLPEGVYYQKGDNPSSVDGMIDSGQILGKVIYISGGKPR